jgi:hypothetical protein
MKEKAKDCERDEKIYLEFAKNYWRKRFIL